ncbi:hypothetical protein JQ594_04330 [Bradyrhizobium manausense]|uniref:methylamine utilization protein MauJ n=1 Tax=Bradyrhizobium manausense TaxID=989370 RepID=UPI001BAD7215|nr:hypothetical protein [Bradyrhizobium manausense]MBR0685130.1 hypothetical protein [Bradyrhizobium manausense]
MRRWLADFRVQSELSMPQGVPSLEYRDPDGAYQVRIKETKNNVRVEERLSAELTFSAPDLATAEQTAREHLQKFLHLLSFVTSCGFRITRTIAIIDWQPGGTGIREAFIYGPSDRNSDLGQALSTDLLNTIEMLKSWGTTPVLETALRWFASGVRSTVMEDQFQLFWFVIEIIGASISAPKVVDKCVRCGGELSCNDCGAVSEHRPFPKQKISELLKEGGVTQLRIDNLFYVRNALLHGTPREDIEKAVGTRDPTFSFHDIVDFAGRTAWSLILHTFQKPPGEHRPQFLQVNTFVDWNISAKAHVQIGIPGHPNNPQYDASVLPKIWMHRGPGEPKPPG